MINLRNILRFLGVSTGNMEEGSFRCDANISIRPENSQDSLAKVEVKNMNSFKAVYQALEYEAKRQRKAVAEGKKLTQETRGWIEEKSKTVSQRSKEYAHDYRYFPEPDLPPLMISREWVEKIRAKLPELPEARRNRFMTEYGLPLYDASLLTGSRDMADYFEAILGENSKLSAKEVSNWILGEVSRIMNVNNIDIIGFRKNVSPKQFAVLLTEHLQGIVNSTSGKSVLEEMSITGKDSTLIIQEQGLGQISDTEQLKETASQVIAANAQAVADYRAGKEQALKFLVGQVMKATRGRAEPKLVNGLLKEKLAEVLSGRE